LTLRPLRWSSLSQAVSPSISGVATPEVLDANRRSHRPHSFTHPSILPPRAQPRGNVPK
jgi:hypothetical protein